jgi:hypothetical protein
LPAFDYFARGGGGSPPDSNYGEVWILNQRTVSWSLAAREFKHLQPSLFFNVVHPIFNVYLKLFYLLLSNLYIFFISKELIMKVCCWSSVQVLQLQPLWQTGSFLRSTGNTMMCQNSAIFSPDIIVFIWTVRYTGEWFVFTVVTEDCG